MTTNADIRRLQRTIYKGLDKIVSGYTAPHRTTIDRWWTGKQKSYTFPDGALHNFWSGHRKHASITVQPYSTDKKGTITQVIQIKVVDVGNWNDCKADGQNWWREIPEELLTD